MTLRLGFLASSALVIVGVAYVVVAGLGIARAGLHDPIVDPLLAAMEVLTLFAALLIVVLMAAVYDYAPTSRKAAGLVALSFGMLTAGASGGVHFVALTAGRQTGLTKLEWPSALYAVELLAWDVFLGLSLISAAAVFAGPGLHAWARRTLVAAGFLCLLGTIGPIVGDMALQRVGIVGYGIGLPIACFVLAVTFRRGTPARAAARDTDATT